MSHSFEFLDVDQSIHNTELVINSAAVGQTSDADWSVRMQRINGGLSEGVDVVWLDNGCTRLAILPTRGMGIWKGRVDGVPLQWKSPVERPVNPMFVDQMRRGGIGWLDGFNEILCRCGLGWNGAPGTDVIKDESGAVVSEQFLPLHGRIANLSAHRVHVDVADDGRISVTGIVDEASLFGGKLRLTSTLSTYPGSNTFEIEDTVTNLASSNAEVEMLYHCNFGEPFLGDGSTFHLAVEEVAPRDPRAAEDLDTWTTYLGPTPGYAEQCYLTKPIADETGRALAVLADADRSKSVAIRFETSTLPFFTLWKNTQAAADGYCTGLEPGTGFPNLRSFEREQNRVVELGAEESVTLNLAISVATDEASTKSLIDEVASLQESTAMNVHSAANPKWSG